MRVVELLEPLRDDRGSALGSPLSVHLKMPHELPGCGGPPAAPRPGQPWGRHTSSCRATRNRWTGMPGQSAAESGHRRGRPERRVERASPRHCRAGRSRGGCSVAGVRGSVPRGAHSWIGSRAWPCQLRDCGASASAGPGHPFACEEAGLSQAEEEAASVGHGGFGAGLGAGCRAAAGIGHGGVGAGLCWLRRAQPQLVVRRPASAPRQRAGRPRRCARTEAQCACARVVCAYASCAALPRIRGPRAASPRTVPPVAAGLAREFLAALVEACTGGRGVSGALGISPALDTLGERRARRRCAPRAGAAWRVGSHRASTASPCPPARRLLCFLVSGPTKLVPLAYHPSTPTGRQLRPARGNPPLRVHTRARIPPRIRCLLPCVHGSELHTAGQGTPQ